MSEDFKKKLELYMEGKLPPEEHEQMEVELRKLEEYQEVLDGVMSREDSQGGGSDMLVDGKSERRLIRWAKWKARFMNTMTVIALLVLFLIVSSIFTSIFYTWGEPNRMEQYRRVVESVQAITAPNLELGGISSNAGLFTTTMTTEYRKQIGNRTITVGSFKLKFLLGKPGFVQKSLWSDPITSWVFVHPDSSMSKSPSPDNGWKQLERLPEGTVVEAFISFDKVYSLAEMFALMKDKNMRPIWFAVESGEDAMTVKAPIGMPYRPVLHPEEGTYSEKKVQRGKFGSKRISQSVTYPEVEDFGSVEYREANYMRTLQLLADYDRIADQLVHELDIEDRLAYIKDHGIRLFGVALTGPTKEVLKLRDEPWVNTLHVGEKQLWEW